VLTAAGALNNGLVPAFPFGWIPVLAGVPAATALLLIWSGHRARLGAVQYGCTRLRVQHVDVEPAQPVQPRR
jgi:hypothetical protein